MKKFLVLALVVAMTCLSTVAFAAEVSVSGEVDIRSRLFENFDFNRNVGDTASRTTTETRYLVSVNVKADNAKAKLTIWNEHDTWGNRNSTNFTGGAPDNAGNKGSGVGTNTTTSLSTVYIREAWIDVMVPGTPVGIKAGRQLMQIGNGWFFRSTYGGSDAWIVYANMGPVTVALQDVKIAEDATGTGTTSTNSNDVDLYSAVVTAKLGDAGTIGLDVSMLKDNSALILRAPTVGNGHQGRLYNVGLQANVKAGPATIKAEVDYQEGYADRDADHRGYRGYQIVIQPQIKAGIVTINALAAMGSGNKANQNTRTAFVNMLDIGQHYTLIYEYRVAGASGFMNDGFTNTTVLSVGALAQVLKNLAVGADVYYLRATERVALKGNDTSNNLGWEIDGKINWNITKDVSWNWQVGYMLPGAAYNPVNGKADAAWGAQGILGMKF